MFSDPLKEYLWGPRLRLDFDPQSPVDAHFTPTFRPIGESYPSFWLRIRVSNNGRSVARDVEVIARKLEFLRDGQFVTHSAFGPLNLKWSYIGEPVMERIPRKTERLLDVFS